MRIFFIFIVLIILSCIIQIVITDDTNGAAGSANKNPKKMDTLKKHGIFGRMWDTMTGKARRYRRRLKKTKVASESAS